MINHVVTNRSYKPSHRVNAAMIRLSRDRWIHPQDVHSMAMSLARCASWGSYSSVVKHSYHDNCNYVGMIQGEPPFYRWDRGYTDMLRLVKRKSKKALYRECAEISILKLVARN